MKKIRKISIGSDYKNDAMHYSLKQEVYGGHVISDILFEDQDESYNIFIMKNNPIKIKYIDPVSSKIFKKGAITAFISLKSIIKIITRCKI